MGEGNERDAQIAASELLRLVEDARAKGHDLVGITPDQAAEILNERAEAMAALDEIAEYANERRWEVPERLRAIRDVLVRSRK